ncbi:hypothetical protein [Aliidiomarina shirensis]|nr:hypothetical protein [Aliidiomarina shirensis]
MEAWTTLGTQGKISFGKPEKHRGNFRLIVSLMHTNFESAIRGYPKAPKWVDAALPKTKNINQNRLQRMNALLSRYESCLFKFGQREFLEQLSFKVSLASSFDDKSLHPAQRDNELSRAYKPHPSLGTSPFNRGSYEKPIMERYRVDASFDYYVFCLSRRADLRMFGDFGADAVLIIKNKQALQQGLKRKLEKELKLSRILSAPVSYYDDIRDAPSGLEPPELAKHFRFFYQQEYRIAFIPQISGARLNEHFFFELPELRESTELVIF